MDQRRIAIQRFASTRPPGILSHLWRKMFLTKPATDKNAPGTDAYLERMSQRKDGLNQQFLKLLREVGTTKEGVMNVAFQFGKQAVNLTAEGKAGPYDADLAGQVRGLDRQIAGMEHNRHEHPYHYYLNPFVAGPLSELANRAVRRSLASRVSGKLPLVAGVAGNMVGDLASKAIGAASDVPFVPSIPLGGIGNVLHGGPKKQEEARQAHEATSGSFRDAEVDRDLEKAGSGPFDTQLASNVGALDDRIGSLVQNRQKHPYHYYLNPFVPGPLTEVVSRFARRVSAGMHGSWPETLAALPTLGIAPAIAGGAAAKTRAREDYGQNIAKYEDAPPPGEKPINPQDVQHARRERTAAKPADELGKAAFAFGKAAAAPVAGTGSNSPITTWNPFNPAFWGGGAAGAPPKPNSVGGMRQQLGVNRGGGMGGGMGGPKPLAPTPPPANAGARAAVPGSRVGAPAAMGGGKPSLMKTNAAYSFGNAVAAKMGQGLRTSSLQETEVKGPAMHGALARAS